MGSDRVKDPRKDEKRPGRETNSARVKTVERGGRTLRTTMRDERATEKR